MLNIKHYTIDEFDENFPDDNACLKEVFNQQFGNLKECPRCTNPAKFYKITGRKRYDCQYCAYQIHPLADTIFYKSSTSLKKWFRIIYQFSVSKNGVSAYEIRRMLGVTYKCALRMARQIRSMCFSKKEKSNKSKLKGTVEVDETYIGGKRRGKRGRGAEGKTPVIGIVERGGEIKATVTENTKAKTILPLIKENVEEKTKVMTDEYSSYNKVSSLDYVHDYVSHSKKEYVRGEVHTNTVEGFWSQLKRSINGTYHSVSKKYLQFYVDEFAYRYNLRHSGPLFPHWIALLAGKPSLRDQKISFSHL